MPLLTAILAFHRVTPYLEPAVRSLLDQTFRDFELLVVDDGTGLGPAALGAAAGDARLRVLSVPACRGIVHAHNLAVHQARGDYVALMDYDDIALPGRFAAQLEALQADPRLGWLGTHSARIDASGKVLGPKFTLPSAADSFLFSAYTMPATSPTFAGRREVLTAFPMREPFSYCGDFDLLSRIAESWTVRSLPECHLHYREHGNQTTETGSRHQNLGLSLARLFTARRRAGRAENLEATVGSLAPWLAQPPALDANYRHFARQCITERFPVLAAYHARRLVKVRRGATTFAQALGLVVKAAASCPRQAQPTLRMFFTGPLRTHGLRPV